MTIRVAHISDLHIARSPGTDPEGEIAYFEVFVKRALPVAASVVVIGYLARPRVREAVLELLESARDRVGEVDRVKFAAVVGGLTAAGAALAYAYRRELMHLWLSLRRDNGRVRERLLRDLATRAVDHVVISGDMTNVASPDEFKHAREFVDELRGATRGVGITLVPGNHDVQDSHPQDGVPDLGLFNEEFGDLFNAGVLYPNLQQVGPLTIVGLNSCTLGEGFGIRGCIGDRQREKLDALLMRAEGGPKALVLHHHMRRRSPLDRSLPPLDDADELLDIARERGVRLVFHGHKHTLYEDETTDIPLVCAGSTTLGGGGWRSRPGYRVFGIENSGDLGQVPEVIRLDG